MPNWKWLKKNGKKNIQIPNSGSQRRAQETGQGEVHDRQPGQAEELQEAVLKHEAAQPGRDVRDIPAGNPHGSDVSHWRHHPGAQGHLAQPQPDHKVLLR